MNNLRVLEIGYWHSSGFGLSSKFNSNCYYWKNKGKFFGNNYYYWKKVSLSAVGAEADDDKIELLLSEVKGKDITELIASGREKLASVPSGGGGAVAVAATGGGGGAAATPAAAEAKKEEKVEEKEESDDVSILQQNLITLIN